MDNDVRGGAEACLSANVCGGTSTHRRSRLFHACLSTALLAPPNSPQCPPETPFAVPRQPLNCLPPRLLLYLATHHYPSIELLRCVDVHRDSSIISHGIRR